MNYFFRMLLAAIIVAVCTQFLVAWYVDTHRSALQQQRIKWEEVPEAHGEVARQTENQRAFKRERKRQYAALQFEREITR